MEFKITTASGGIAGVYGNEDRIKELDGTTIKIRTLNDLKKIADETDTELCINFKEMKIMIINDYLE
mgnify:CR=1 FL=1